MFNVVYVFRSFFSKNGLKQKYYTKFGSFKIVSPIYICFSFQMLSTERRFLEGGKIFSRPRLFQSLISTFQIHQPLVCKATLLQSLLLLRILVRHATRHEKNKNVRNSHLFRAQLTSGPLLGVCVCVLAFTRGYLACPLNTEELHDRKTDQLNPQFIMQNKFHICENPHFRLYIKFVYIIFHHCYLFLRIFAEYHIELCKPTFYNIFTQTPVSSV